MTLIIGIVDDNGSVFVGGDSGGVSGYEIETRTDKKVFFRDCPTGEKMLIGFSTSFRMGQLLRYGLIIPEHKEGLSNMEYMVSYFVEYVKACLKNGGFAPKSDDFGDKGGYFIVAYRSELFKIECDFQVSQVNRNYVAAGCGENIALGALYANARHTSFSRIRIAMMAAMEHNATIRAPFTVEVLEKWVK